MKRPPVHAVIFDVDGVLIDSYDAHHESWTMLARRTRVEFTEHDFAQSFGRTSADIIRKYWPASPPLTPSRIRELDDVKESIFRDIVRRDFPAMPGATKAVAMLHGAGVKVALGSSGPPENVKLAADQLQISQFLSAIVTGMDVSKGKPDPEVFLVAAKRMGVDPEHCAVVEDAPAGIQAAVSAGMLALGFPSKGRDRKELLDAGAGEIVARLTDIPQLVGL